MAEQYIAAISDNLDAGVALVDGRGRIQLAINEERFCRRKMVAAFPELTVRHLLDRTLIGGDGVELVAIAGYESFMGDLSDAYRWYYGNPILPRLPQSEVLVRIAKKLFLFMGKVHRFRRGHIERLFAEKGGKPTIRVVDHHRAHAASAFYSSGFDEALVLTMDGYGDGCSSTEWRGRGRDLLPIRRHGWGATVAHLYSRITQFLGFRPHLHEGKVTGLAAYGDPRSCRTQIEGLLWIDENGIVDSAPFLRLGFDRARLERLLGRFSREEISAALQDRSEEVVVEWARRALRASGLKNLAVAGGVFANVKINQRLHELDEVDRLWVFPHMGDGGLAVGSALSDLAPQPTPLEHAFLGPAFDDVEIESALTGAGISYQRPPSIEGDVVARLADGQVVARFAGAMEFGPRALGNRSILYRADDPSVNDWLNRKLKRTEFMPFAPVTLAEEAEQCYIGLAGAAHAAEFMTVCFRCTDAFTRMSTGAVHVDGTARPQIVRKEANPGLHRILREYQRITGSHTAINTSFNIHEEPIVHTPREAIRAFEEAELDCLAIGSFVVEAPGKSDGKG